jgi:hypothetical protein
MSILDTIKANPQGITKAVFAVAFAGVSLWFLMVGKPDQATSVNNELSGFVVPITTAITIALSLVSAMHFSRGPVPVVAAPVVVATMAQAEAEGILPKTESPK